MSRLETELVVLSLRYSSWSIRAWLALTHAGIPFKTTTAELAHMVNPSGPEPDLGERRALGSVSGGFPVLWTQNTGIHESLAICEWVAEQRPEAQLWPSASLDRARARALSAEMVSGLFELRKNMPCNVWGRVAPSRWTAATLKEIERVFEIWRSELERSGGPFLFGSFGIVDCMYFPVMTRFWTYGVELPPALASYERALANQPSVRAWGAMADKAPALPICDEVIRQRGGQMSKGWRPSHLG